MRRLLATLLTSLVVAHGAAAAAHPVVCAMSGTVTAGHCCCDVGSGEAALAPACGDGLESPAVASVGHAGPALPLPAVGPSLAVLAPPPAARPPPPAPPDAGPAPPIPIRHRSLLL
jgi:hypothetical protein